MSSGQTRFSFDDPQDAVRLAAYRAAPARPGHYDELRDDDGRLRPAWNAFFAQLGQPGLADLERRAENVGRQIREDGVTYNIYSDEGGPSRPWSLDLLPLILRGDEWAEIERGVVQRATLLSLILHDVYGPATLLREGLLPPALVLGHPGYLRPLAGNRPVGDLFLFMVAFDLARGVDGRWAVVAQRTGAPSGLGYALQNRMIIARMFPDAFRTLRVQRLASSYRRLLDTMFRFAPRDPGEAGGVRIVLLTPGPYNETYFEHAYLARYLGIPLVEGTDLMVRDDRVYLKTLRGLERVHAILRRLDDDFCDPLELRADSTLGVPGLLQAVRAHKVLVANALGSGFLESPALAGFLPAIARRLLGAPLALPALDSWWCGERAALDAVLPRLTELVLKPTYPAGAGRVPFDAITGGRGAEGGAVDAADLAERIVADPDAFTAQAFLPFSQLPTWQRGALVPRAAMLRVYAIADDLGKWHAMPGGLTRIGVGEQQRVSMQTGGSSADAWVLADGQVDPFTMVPESLHAEDLPRQRRPVTSRVAENLFWMGRYAERTEHGVRLARAALGMLGDDVAAPPGVLHALGRLCEQQSLVPYGVPSPTQSVAVFERTLVHALGRAPELTGIAYNLAALARAGGQIRDRLSAEHWRMIVGAQAQFAADCATAVPEGGMRADEGGAAIDRLSRSLSAITGAQADHMTRDDGWRLLVVGRQLERLALLTGALGTVFGTRGAARAAGYELLLALFDSSITFRAMYQRRFERAPVLDLLVREAANPRALACVTAELWTQLGALQGSTERLEISGVSLSDPLPQPSAWPSLAALCADDAHGQPAALLGLCDDLGAAAAALSDAIGQRYFSHAEPVFQALAG
jgi:uncharacterized circularly permuted ATP-grasp superfamily protein/uncharacterized alpha-E superfamily protein